MDSAFQLGGNDRANFFQSVMQTFGSTYICLWSYSQQSNCLFFLDGCYREESSQPSSSSGSLALRLFHDYCQTIVPLVEYDAVPGLAFKNGQQYLEVNQSELQRLASSEQQRLFYQEARIKTAVFMGCKTGEIELGLSQGSQSNIEVEMRHLIQKDFTVQQSPQPAAVTEIPLTAVVDPTVHPPSSSSSSLRSLSIDTPSEYSSFLFNISSKSTSPQQQTMQPFAQLPNIQFPITPEIEQAEITRAILAVLTSSIPSSFSDQPYQKASAFKKYNLHFGLPPTSQIRASSSSRPQSMLKRAISYYRRLNLSMSRHDHTPVASSSTSSKLHHVIKERKRREKINDSFRQLRSMLPPETKKDKASLLISTKEYLSSLKDQINELNRRNQILEAQVLAAPKEAPRVTNIEERVQVRVTPVSESTSEWRIVDVGVIVRGECPQLDIVIGILKFLKTVENLGFISVEANTQITDSTPFNHVLLRLRIQGNEWDESAFEEAVRRVVADLAQ